MAALLEELIQAKAIITAFSTSLMNKVFLLLLTIFCLTSCSGSKKSTSPIDDAPSWYVIPKQNNATNLYGIGAGFSLEDATKSALTDAAARLMVSISSTSTLLREENKFDVNEESRQQIKQNIEKIEFTNFQVSRSGKIASNFFIELEISRLPFISAQKENITFLEKKVADLEKSLNNINPIQKRASLLKIVDLSKQIELSSRILKGAGENISLKEKLSRLANFENQLNLLNNKIEFYFEINSSKEITQLIGNALNKEQIAITKTPHANSVTIEIKSTSRSNEIYGAHITKLHLDFENILNGKTIASNSFEVTGSSVIGEKESYLSAVKSLEEKISKDGILKIIGIIN